MLEDSGGVEEQKGLEQLADMEAGRESEVHDEQAEDSPTRPKSPQAHGTISRLHAQLQHALESSPLLNAVHVAVKNNSYWYKSRHQLGPKKHAACMVKQDASSRWESSIYIRKPRESDGTMVPTKTFIATHKSRWAAYRKCEAGQRERDANPWAAVPNGDPDAVLSTHFHLLIVSQAFDRLSPMMRNVLVFEALLAEMGQQLTPTQPAPRCEYTYGRSRKEHSSYGLKQHNSRVPDGTVTSVERSNEAHLAACPPASVSNGLRLGSTYGPAMCSLDLFRVLFASHPHQPGTDPGAPNPLQGVHLFMECRTPSQWRPEQFEAPASERYGSSHLGFQASTVPSAVQGPANKSRMRLLSHVQAQGADRFGRDTAAAAASASASAVGATGGAGGGASANTKTLLSLAETLGVDPIVSGAKYRRTGGVYGHFFSDLPREVKQMIMEKFVENKKLIQREGNRKVDPEGKKKKKKKDTFQPKTGMSMLRAKIASQLVMAEYDAGTGSEAEMVEEVYIAASKFERVAHRLQRIRRGSCVRQASRYMWWRRWAAIVIQKLVRGRYARMYATLLARLRPRAVVPLQRRFRHRRSQRLLRRWQAMTLRMTRVVWPKMKKFLRNCFLNLTWKLTSNTVLIQSVCRMYIAKVRCVRMKEEKRLFADPLSFILPFHLAAVTIQRRHRGNVGRRGYSDRIEAMLVKRVDTPRAILIQKIFRGLLGRRKAKKQRYRLDCQLLLQRVVRKYIRRVWDAQLARARLEMRCATMIQKVVRGRVDRVLVRYSRADAWYTRKLIPAVFLVQKNIRGWHARRLVKVMRRRLTGARAMQATYRRYQVRGGRERVGCVMCDVW